LAGRVRLLQVLANLLTNAWYACREQDAPSISASVLVKSDIVQISLTDNGPGIDLDVSDRIFDAFVTKRDHATGMGLGLTISRSFIESMDGDLCLTHFKLSLSQDKADWLLCVHRLVEIDPAF